AALAARAAPAAQTAAKPPPTTAATAAVASAGAAAAPNARTTAAATTAAAAATAAKAAADGGAGPSSVVPSAAPSAAISAAPPASASAAPPPPPPVRSESPPPPLKSLTFRHLRRKYSPELDYMLVEFRKLERQLLGAPGLQRTESGKAIAKPEGAGSRERREKLHGFILHLEDTIRQIAEGCESEDKDVERERSSQTNESGADANGKKDEGAKPQSQSLPKDNFTAADASLSALTPAKEKEESVQRLEEHVLANLLPVKIRLTRQLAAQKGAVRNPATAPVQPGQAGVASTKEIVEARRKEQEKARLLEEERRRQREALAQPRGGAATTTSSSSSSGGPTSAPAPSQYGKPLGAGRSSLTSRLHGRTLGPGGAAAAGTSSASSSATTAASPAAATSAAPAAAAANGRRPILYAGMAPGSEQVSSSVGAAEVHPGLIGRDAARAAAALEEERRRMARLEEGAARIAAGDAGAATASTAMGTAAVGTTTAAGAATALKSPPEGPAAVASGVPAATATAGAARPAPRPAAPPAAAPIPPAPPPKPKRPHVPPNYDDPSLSPEARRELRTNEARWRQRKRRRERRRRRAAAMGTAGGAFARVALRSPQFPQPRAAPPRPSGRPQPQLRAELGADAAAVVAGAVAADDAGARVATGPGPSEVPAGAPGIPSGVGASSSGGTTAQANAEYVCSLCNESYPSHCGDANPWWALVHHDCPKCEKAQLLHQSSKGDASGRFCRVTINDIREHPRRQKELKSRKLIRPFSDVMAAHYDARFRSTHVRRGSSVAQTPAGQIPRLDIAAPANAMDYHPALLSHLDEGGGGGGGGKIGVADVGGPNAVVDAHRSFHPAPAPFQPSAAAPPAASVYPLSRGRPLPPSGMSRGPSPGLSDSDVSHTDESDGEGGATGYGVGDGVDYGASSDEDEGVGRTGDGDFEDEDTVAREERIDREEFGYEYRGEKLTDDQATKLLVLIEHASTCPGRNAPPPAFAAPSERRLLNARFEFRPSIRRHRSAKHRNVCHSTKYLMLHVRDCPGLLSNGDLCPFPWCRKVKHLLYHLVGCAPDPAGGGGEPRCPICRPDDLSPNLRALVGLNAHRREKFRERVKLMVAKRLQMAKAAAAAAAAAHAAENAVPSNGAVANPVATSRASAAAPVPRFGAAARRAHAPAASLQPARLRAPAAAPAPASMVPRKAAPPKPPLRQPPPRAAVAPAAIASGIAPAATARVAARPPAPAPVDSRSPSPIPGIAAALSAGALPTLEEAALEMGDIGLSSSDLAGVAAVTTEAAAPGATT
ncbi:hypothetical protein ACHAWF_008867, partial [Thalassiosira exigua]